METFLQWLLENSVKAGILALIVWAVVTIFSRRIPARWKYFLWAMVAVRLIMPNVFPAQFSLFNLGHSLSKQQIAAMQAPMLQPAPPVSAVSPAATGQTVSPVIAVKTTPAISPWQIAFLVWLAGTVVLGFLIILRIYRLSAKVVKQRPLTDQNLLELLEDCKEKMNIHVPVSVVSSPVVKSPALLGFIRPRLLLPDKITNDLPTGDLRNIFFHELTHLKRNDIAVNWVVTAIQLLHWFNPVVWLAFAQMRAAREQACDETVLTLLGSEERKNYGHTIINLLQSSPRPSPLVGTAGIMEDKQQMEKRIKMISTFKIMPLRSSILAVVLIAALGMFCLSEAKSQEKPEAKTTVNTPKANFWDKIKLWDMLRKGTDGIIPADQQKAAEMLPALMKDVYLVKFKPINDFKPATPSAYLTGFNKCSPLQSKAETIGGASFFRTTNVGDEYIGSFLTDVPEQMKTDLDKSTTLKWLSCEKVTPEIFVKYFDSPQEDRKTPDEKARLNYWKNIRLWNMLRKGTWQIPADPQKAAEMLPKMINNVYMVKFKAINNFNPETRQEYLDGFSKISSLQSGKESLGGASAFLTVNVGDEYIGSFLTETPEKMKADLDKSTTLKWLSCEKVTPAIFVKYCDTPQEDRKHTSSKEPQSIKVAIATAEKWLALIDAGKYSEGWDEAARFFKNNVSKEQWNSLIKGVRTEFGMLKSRQIKNTTEASSLPGAPDGKYLVIQFNTSFEHKKASLEILTLMLDHDGKWQVAGYYITEPKEEKPAVKPTANTPKANFWEKITLWNSLRKGTGGVIADDKQKADEILREILKDIYLVKFKPTKDFDPDTFSEYLVGFNKCSSLDSEKETFGSTLLFRATNVGNEYIGSFLTNKPDQMKNDLAKSNLLQWISCEKATPEIFIKQYDSVQENKKRPVVLSKEQQIIADKLNLTVIKHLEIKDLPLPDAIKTIESPGVVIELAMDPDQLKKLPKITLIADNITLKNALEQITGKINTYYRIAPDKVIVGHSIKAATTAAEQWLALLDARKYTESWDESSWFFRKITPKEHWKSLVLQINMAIGKSLSRKITNIREESYLPGSFSGKYVIIEYDSSFEKRKISSEIMLMMLENDGKWRVHSYHIG